MIPEIFSVYLGECYEKNAFRTSACWLVFMEASQVLAYKPVAWFSTWVVNLTSHSMKESGMDLKNSAKKLGSSTVNLKLRTGSSARAIPAQACHVEVLITVIAVGFGQAAALTKVAKEFQKTKVHSIIDMVVDPAKRTIHCF